jgi:hypothetical protein
LTRESEEGTQSVSPARMSVDAMKRVVPIISAYTRLPLVSKQRRYGNSQRSSVNYQSPSS